MSEALFDLKPAALIYRRPHSIPTFKMQCRDCHESRTINGGGSVPAQHDETRGGGYDYAICQRCFTTTDLGRTCTLRGRDLIEMGAAA